MAKTKRATFPVAAAVLLITTLFLCSCKDRQDSTSPHIESIKIASWNIRDFSDASRDDEELQHICNILKEYNLIAIMELIDENVLIRAQNMLRSWGLYYDYEVSDPVGRSPSSMERYAFLYDTDKVYVVEPGLLYPDPEDKFTREPYYATFRSGNFDFTIIVVHVIWGDTVGERQAEIQELAPVFQDIQDANASEQDVLLVGDFNREPNDDLAYGDLWAIESMEYLFHLPLKSMIVDSNLFDNIFYQPIYVTEYTGWKGINRFDETMFANDDNLANLMVSDHRPVWAEFNTNEDDDD